MPIKNKTLLILFLSISIAIIIYAAWTYSKPVWFKESALPVQHSHRLFDVGIVDVNEDGFLDIFTSNHHFRQLLLVSNGKGGFEDKLSEYGLDQSPLFPNAELAFTHPTTDKPGLYLYWFGTQFVIRSHDLKNPENYSGTFRTNDWVKIVVNSGFKVDIDQQKTKVSETRVTFTPSENGRVVLNMGGQGLPLPFEFGKLAEPARIYVGQGKVSPESSRFTLTMQDRHALAWIDFNDDGMKDIFINRGALGGRLRAYPPHIIDAIFDEFLVSNGKKRYTNIVHEAGIEKKGCSGRHARWVDIDGDGMLDLFNNCYDRRNPMTIGKYPKQLYRQDTSRHFKDIAKEVGLGLPDLQFGSLVFVDADDDNDADLITFVNDGIVLFRNENGRFHQENIYERPVGGPVKIGGTTGDDWLFDGRFTTADYDNDGDLDLFFSSKKGNLLIENREGSYVVLDPVDAGLPNSSMTANWVDFDNDGYVDLHLVPQGIYRQSPKGYFDATGLLEIPSDQYRAAICNWFDADNDGRVDVLLALSQEPAYKSWTEIFSKKKKRPQWDLKLLRNIGTTDHWLQVRLAGNRGNPNGIGARVTVTTPDGNQVQEMGVTDGSFFSQGHYRLYFGLGKYDHAEKVTIHWPDGNTQVLKNIEGDRLHVFDRSRLDGK